MRGAKFLTQIWLDWYCTEHCTLCGNTGIIDTRQTAITPAGVSAGRLNWCLCPNGRGLREQLGREPTSADLYHWSGGRR